MEKPILDTIEAEARTLIQQKLRSKAVVVARLEPLISEANHLGHSHEDIHARLCAGGLDASLKSYSTYLYRARKPKAGATARSGSYEPNAKIGSNEPKTALTRTSSALEGSEPQVESDKASPDANSTTAVLDALTQASKTARRDYSAVVKQDMKNQQARPVKTSGRN